MPILSTHTQRVYDTVKEKISTFQLKPGTRLVEEQIAEEVGVSRTPVREALNRLGQEGLVKIFPKWGSYVREIDLEEIREVFDLREVLEGMAARVAASRISEKEIVELKRFCQECDHFGKRNGSFELQLKSDMKFHELLVRASRNKRLQKIVGLFNIQVRNFRIFNPLPPGKKIPISGTTKEHSEIIKALSEHNPDLAEKATREHIRKAKEKMEKRYESPPHPFLSEEEN